MNLVATALYD